MLVSFTRDLSSGSPKRLFHTRIPHQSLPCCNICWSLWSSTRTSQEQGMESNIVHMLCTALALSKTFLGAGPLFSQSAFISSFNDCIRNVFLLLLWHSDLFASPRASFIVFHRTIPELFIHIFWISSFSAIWLAIQYTYRVWFPTGRLCLQAVFRKFPSTSSFSSIGNSFIPNLPATPTAFAALHSSSWLFLLQVYLFLVLLLAFHSFQCPLSNVTPA